MKRRFLPIGLGVLLLSFFSITLQVGTIQGTSSYLFFRWWVPLWLLGALVSVWCIGNGLIYRKDSSLLHACLYVPLALLLAMVLYTRQHRLPVEYVRDNLYYASQTYKNVFYSLNTEDSPAHLPVFGYASEFLLGFFATAAAYRIIQEIQKKDSTPSSWRADWKSNLFWAFLPLLVAYVESLSISAEKLFASISATSIRLSPGSIDAPWWRWAASFASNKLSLFMLFVIPAAMMLLYHRRVLPQKIVRCVGIVVPIAYLALISVSPFVSSGFTDLISSLPQQVMIAPTLCMGAFFGIALRRAEKGH